ncbi:TPA: hypothetical protein N0F65_004163 [Lagenidium giganteum]|uniref:Uncharacterized protein n=1 Tax=Lagenidium giganteum TaxID=4803 RepID=A0AAV2Z8M6_9STRA|nr:TPA: hypothetical protein N0F65_004163 [Lagenidium giganteum]
METRSSPSMCELRAVAADRGLKYYMHLAKSDLHALLLRKNGTTTGTKLDSLRASETAGKSRSQSLAKAVRTSARLSERKRKAEDGEMPRKKKGKAPEVTTNTLDPIMLTELGPHTFKFVRTNGSIVLYNVDTLVQYILSTGDFSEPETRIPFSDEDLRQMDAGIQRAKLDFRSVWEAKQNKREFEEKKVSRDGLLGLERCAGEFISSMLEIVEGDDPEVGEMQLIMSTFPSFSDVFGQIRSQDEEFAKQCLNHFKEYLRGPPNRPNMDNSGLLPVILEFLDDVGKGNQSASAFGF